MSLGPDARRIIFDAAKRRGATFFTRADVADMDAAIDQAFALGVTKPVAPAPVVVPKPVSHLSLTPRVALELVSHEAIVREAYKDSVGVWTWGIGVTDKSGHKVMRYKDAPQSIEHVLRVYLWLLREKYIPDVVKAFAGYTLTEAQFAAALSFHYNTGAILKASWVKKVKAGDLAGAAKAIMDWNKPREILERRGKERDLFFGGDWSYDGKVTVYEVRKPSYAPNWRTAKRVDITADLAAAMKGE